MPMLRKFIKSLGGYALLCAGINLALWLAINGYKWPFITVALIIWILFLFTAGGQQRN